MREIKHVFILMDSMWSHKIDVHFGNAIKHLLFMVSLLFTMISVGRIWAVPSDATSHCLMVSFATHFKRGLLPFPVCHINSCGNCGETLWCLETTPAIHNCSGPTHSGIQSWEKRTHFDDFFHFSVIQRNVDVKDTFYIFGEP
jgi:hypothetical protein